jgi:hypothetical protein
MTIVDGATTWTITDTDTAKKGRGEIQLKYTAGEKVKTSPIFTISCGESLIGDGEPPSGYEDWLTELNRMTAQVEAAKTSADQSAQTAQTAAGTAAEKASEAEQSANVASGFANNASASAASANTSAQAASQSAQAASVARTAAEAAAISAQAEAEDAEAAKTAAQTAEASAQGFAQTASAKASQAAESAAQAQASADRANVDILRFLPTDSASGAVASFTDGADNVPLKSLVVGINPVQSGEGDPSPTNVRPISGWTGMTVNANGTEIPISWESEAGTLYGGSLDVLNGILTVDRKRVVYDGTNATWRMYTASGVIRMQTQVDDMVNVGGITYNGEYVVICNIGKTQTPDAIGTVRNYQRRLWYYPPAGIDTVESFNSWLAENNLEVVYMLAGPITYQLTPTEIKSVLGINNIYADCGNVAVVYRADTTMYINRKIAEAINALA